MVLFLREMRSSSFLWLLWTRIKEWNSTPDTVRPHWDAAADTPEIMAEQACCVDLLWIEDFPQCEATVLPPLITSCVGESHQDFNLFPANRLQFIGVLEDVYLTYCAAPDAWG